MFLNLSKNLSAVTNDNYEPQEYPHHKKYLQGNSSMCNMHLNYSNVLPDGGEASRLQLASLVQH